MNACNKAKWHYDADNFPQELPPEQGFVHTGMFLGWCIERHLLSPELLDNFPDFVAPFESRSKTAPEIFQLMDGVLPEDELSETCAARNAKWDGQWWTTVWGKMSVCECVSGIQ